jgi:hypothetical protein
MVREVEKLFQVSATFCSDRFHGYALPVFAVVGRMVMLFALLMLVPLAFAWFGGDGRKGLHADGASLLTPGAVWQLCC